LSGRLVYKTTREISGYVATCLKSKNDVKNAIKTLFLSMMTLQNDLPVYSSAQKRHWEKKLMKSVKKCS